MVVPDGQAAHKSFFLLKVEPCELAVILLCDTGCLEYVVGKLLFVVGGVEHEESEQEHSLISALQIL